jgi:hypothetical protein
MNRQIIGKPDMTDRRIKKNYDTDDIIKLITAVLSDPKKSSDEVRAFAQNYSATRESLRKLYWDVKDHIIYKTDPQNTQLIQRPRRLWNNQKGDCKSLTVFICSVLQCLEGVTPIVRFAWYADQDFGHVYPLAKLRNGETIILDTVWHEFDEEKRPIKDKKDFVMKAGLYELAGIGAADDDDDFDAELDALDDSFGEDSELLEDDGGDITQMSEGDFVLHTKAAEAEATASAFDKAAKMTSGRRTDNSPLPQASVVLAKKATVLQNVAQTIRNRFQRKGVSGNGEVYDLIRTAAMMTSPAVQAPMLMMDQVSGFGAAKKGEKVKKVWQKLVNWLFKKALPKVAPFFLFAFITKKVSAAVQARKTKLMQILQWIAKTTGTKYEQLLATIKTAIISKFGKKPEEVLNAAAKGKSIAGIGFVAITAATITAALPFIKDVIQKVIKFFKKKDAPSLDNAGSDLSLLGNEDGASIAEPGQTTVPTDEWAKPNAKPAKPVIDLTKKNRQNVTADDGKDSGNMMLYLLLGGGALFALSR